MQGRPIGDDPGDQALTGVGTGDPEALEPGGPAVDSRMFRIDPPSTVDWYDVGFPEVAAARRQLLPDRANAHAVGSDLTDPNWPDAVPTGRPAVIVADGLLAFLTPTTWSPC